MLVRYQLSCIFQFRPPIIGPFLMLCLCQSNLLKTSLHTCGLPFSPETFLDNKVSKFSSFNLLYQCHIQAKNSMSIANNVTLSCL